jgi:type IV pilus assembly protein PilM
MWAQKSKFFIVAALILLAASILALLRTNIDLKAYTSGGAENKRKETENILQMAKDTANSLNEQQARAAEYQKIIEKYTDSFNYRNIIPLLNETILKTLPNAKNNTAQAELYEAYAKGNFEKIKQIPRNQRKLVFITNMSIDYANSLAAAQFEIGRSRRSSRTRGEGIGGEEDGSSAPPATTGAGSSEQQDSKGFIVIIEGYTPYEKIGELMDPAGVGDDKQKWGIITRMLNLNQLFDVNSPFELFQKNKIEHFKFETGLVDLQDQQMPKGIGVNQTKTRVTLEESAVSDSRKSTRTKGQDADLVVSEVVLVDPLTKEEISRTFDLDEKGRKKYDTFGQPLYIERDRWFRIKAKFIWKDTWGQQRQAPTGM